LLTEATSTTQIGISLPNSSHWDRRGTLGIVPIKMIGTKDLSGS